MSKGIILFLTKNNQPAAPLGVFSTAKRLKNAIDQVVSVHKTDDAFKERTWEARMNDPRFTKMVDVVKFNDGQEWIYHSQEFTTNQAPV